MVDIHTHILPNMDDGASSFEEALAMLEMMIDNGVTTAVATPHFNPNEDDINEFIRKRDENFNQLNILIEERRLPINIIKGAEVMYSQAILSMNLDDLTIGDTEYILIELPTRYDDPTFERGMSALLAMGYTPVLAHVERYSYLIDNSQRLVNLINEGVLTQVNAKSINNSKYPYINAMFKRNLVHFIGSDAHGVTKREPNVIPEIVREEIYSNSRKLIRGNIVDNKVPKKIMKIMGIYL